MFYSMLCLLFVLIFLSLETTVDQTFVYCVILEKGFDSLDKVRAPYKM